MFTRRKPQAVQDTQEQPSTIQTTANHGAIQRVEVTTASDGGRPVVMSPRTAAAKGFAQTFGLDPRAAILTVLVDLMVFTGDTVSLETLLPLGIGVAAVLGFIVYRIQRNSYGDNHADALTKALIVGLLTAIPFPLTPLIAIPSGLVGVVKAIRRR